MAVLLIEDGYFYIRKSDNNYSISMTIFGYNPKLSFIEYYLDLLQKPQKQPLEVFCKRNCS